ncbi:uDP-N-acetylenolpyruvoylglucosamine reductase [Clostridium sp. CAG:715]|nr:uDP-N-acetylenolpyruvoylglucosamine reductase [Clostridium sp. CAG:715]
MLQTDFDIKKSTTMKIGGKIARFYTPETIDEFVQIMQKEPKAFIAGNLSNVIVSSFGYDGAVISTKKLNKIQVDGNKIIAGAGVRGTKLSKIALENGLSGMEFMIAFPGSIGGEVYMNAGAHGQEIASILKFAKIYSPQDGLLELSNKELEFGYRTSICHKKNYSVLEVEFELLSKSRDEIQLKIDENLSFRKSKQPDLTIPNCGSTFKNPTGDSAGRLLDAVGVKGLKVGGMKVWENHANFIVNDGEATSLDALQLMFEMYKRVKEKFNIELKPEIIFLGGNNEKEVEICKILYQK